LLPHHSSSSFSTTRHSFIFQGRVIGRQSESALFEAITNADQYLVESRAHARGKASYVNYEYTTNKAQEIVAGWSEYHGRVTLTPKVTFKRKEDDTISQEQDEL
jgi:hypothetical protein